MIFVKNITKVSELNIKQRYQIKSIKQYVRLPTRSGVSGLLVSRLINKAR